MATVVCILMLSAASAGAAQDTMTYLHRSRKADLRAVELKVRKEADGSARYVIDDFPFGREGSQITFLIGPDGRPAEYASKAKGTDGSEWKMVFGADAIVLKRKMPGKPDEEFNCAVRPGSLPDLNSRPDPYLTQHLLIRAYDFSKGGKQVFPVYDVDDTGHGISAYDMSLELVDQEGVVLPNGKFKAKHLVFLQQSSAPTWYKKHRGSQTDIWVSDEGVILRVFRHREPYEIILQDYDKKGDLISASESAQGYPQPPVKAP